MYLAYDSGYKNGRKYKCKKDARRKNSGNKIIAETHSGTACRAYWHGASECFYD